MLAGVDGMRGCGVGGGEGGWWVDERVVVGWYWVLCGLASVEDGF